MNKLFLGLSAVALIAFTSCEKKEAIPTSDAENVAEKTETSSDFVVDTETSNVEWRGYKILDGETDEQGHHGTMKLSSGTIHLENNQIVAGEFVIDASSIEAMDLIEDEENKGKLEGHLKSADFLDVETYPSPTFNITSVHALDGDYNTEISGNLKMREVEKNISFKANVDVDNDKLSIASEEFTINRKDFGIVFNPAKGSVIRDNVTLRVNVQADKTASTEDVNEVEVEIVE